MPVDITGTVQFEATLSNGLVKKHPSPLYINVEPFRYDMGGIRGVFNGAVAQAVTDDDQSYVYLSEAETLVINTTGWPTEVSYIPLAVVTTANGAISDITDERVLLASSAAVIGTCRIGFPVDAGVRGGNAAASSNNSIASVTFDDVGESRNRWNIRPPQNYTSGNLTLRLLCSVAGSPGSNSMRMGLKYTGESEGDTLPSSYDTELEQTVSLSGISNDELFKIDFTMTAASFDKTKDLLAFYLFRDGDHSEDTTSLTLHIHIIELRYTGYKVAGQAGQ